MKRKEKKLNSRPLPMLMSALCPGVEPPRLPSRAGVAPDPQLAKHKAEGEKPVGRLRGMRKRPKGETEPSLSSQAGNIMSATHAM